RLPDDASWPSLTRHSLNPFLLSRSSGRPPAGTRHMSRGRSLLHLYVHAAIDVDDLPCDIPGQRAGEEGNRLCYLCRSPPPAGRDKAQISCFDLIWQGPGHIGFDEPWSDGVDGDRSRSQLFGEGLGKANHPGLGRSIGDLTRIAYLGNDRSQIDDPPGALTYHGTRHSFGAEEYAF